MPELYNRKFMIDSKLAANLAFVLFFSYRSWYGILRLSRSRITILLSIAAVYAFVVIAAVLSKRKSAEVLCGLIPVLVAALIFGVTWFFHPEYTDWFLYNPDYSLLRSVFFPTGGIFAFLFIFMSDDPEEMRRNMRIVAYLMLLFAVFQLIPVIREGHWNTAARTGTLVNQGTYSLGFGYRTVLCPMVFWSETSRSQNIKRKLWYLGMTGIGLWMILGYGGRGCLLAFLMFLVFRYLATTEMLSFRNVAIIAIAAFFFFLWASGILMQIFTALMSSSETLASSRTLQRILSGDFFKDPARSTIWSLAIDMIRTGGLFGRGAYGDRLTIGRHYPWGYSHNILLEMTVAFGILGVLILLLFLAGVIRFFQTVDVRWKEMFVIFLGLSCQLLVSDSFWYNTAFWAVLGFLFKQMDCLLGVPRIAVPAGGLFSESHRSSAPADGQPSR